MKVWILFFWLHILSTNSVSIKYLLNSIHVYNKGDLWEKMFLNRLLVPGRFLQGFIFSYTDQMKIKDSIWIPPNLNLFGFLKCFKMHSHMPFEFRGGGKLKKRTPWICGRHTPVPAPSHFPWEQSPIPFLSAFSCSAFSTGPWAPLLHFRSARWYIHLFSVDPISSGLKTEIGKKKRTNQQRNHLV